MTYDAKLHEGRFSGSSFGCPRSMALRVMGYKSKISKKLQEIFDEGQEHDEVMKEEAEEEFDDFFEPDGKVFKLSDGETTAEITVTPDGLRDDEVVEFKGLNVNNWNSIKTVEDLAGKDARPLFQKYYKQVQIYAGLFGKDTIRFRVKNKKNLKVKDIMVDFDEDFYDGLIEQMLEIQALIDKGDLPPIACNKAEEKFCRYKATCKSMAAKDYEKIPEKKFSTSKKRLLTSLGTESRTLKEKIDDLKEKREVITDKLKDLMRSHGQKNHDIGDNLVVQYGMRYKNVKDKETVDRLVEDGTIPTEEIPDEYLTVKEVE